MTTERNDIQQIISDVQQIKQEVANVIVGQQAIIDQLLIAMLAGGHCLLEGAPGLAKTLMVSTLSQTLSLDFRRVQFTPDLMPSDIIGTEILEQDHSSGQRFFKFQKGPVFTQILLADEINRTPPKTQAALLEAMQERRVSYGGTTYPLPRPFFVLATQNPVEQAGTYPLPEAQLDRFLLFVTVNYPNKEEEAEILQRTTGRQHSSVSPLIDAQTLLDAQQLVRDIEIAAPWMDYIVRLVRASRPAEDGVDLINQYIRWGAGPRAGQALVLCAKASALLAGRLAVTQQDIHAVTAPVLRHRLLLNFQAEAENISVDSVIQHLLEQVSLPPSPL